MLATIFLWFNFLVFDESNYYIKNYTIRDGLASNMVYTITKDYYGRYWIGTSGGLQMFDGYQYRNYGGDKGIISEILGAECYNNFLYVSNLDNLQIIPLRLIDKNINPKIYRYNSFDKIGRFFTGDSMILLFRNSFELYSMGVRKKSVQIANPHFNFDKHTVYSLTSKILNSNHKSLNYEYQIGNSSYVMLKETYGDKYFVASVDNENIKIEFLIPSGGSKFYTRLKDSTLYQYRFSVYATLFINKARSKDLFKGIQVHNINEINSRIFFLTTTNGLIQYIEKSFVKNNANNWIYSRVNNQILNKEYLNLYNHYFKYVYLNNQLREIKTNKILFSTNQNQLNQNIKSHYVLNGSLILLGYRKGTNTILYNYKTRKIRKEFDPVWVKKVRAEDEKNLYILTYDDFRIYKNDVKKVYQLKHKGNYVLTNDLLRSGSQYIYGTNDQGVFISDTNFKFKKHYHLGNGLQSNLIHQLKESDDGQIWLRSEKGIDRILKNGNVERIFAFDEIEEYDIKDFTASQDSLWVFTEKNVYALEYKTRLQSRKIPLVWHNLTVNDTQNFYPIDSNISIGPQWEKLKIEYAGIHLEDQSNIRYRYRIVYNGDTANWIQTAQTSFLSSSFKSGDYTIQIQAFHQIYPNTCSEIKNIAFRIEPYFYQTWWFYSFIFIGSIVGALSILFYRNKLKLRALQMEAELHKTTLHGLQTQMNPHFVFNAIHTLQHFILEKDLDSSLKYLNEFSSLIRTILDNSSHFEIFLKDEIAFLKKYILVESKRFENQFQSEFIVEIETAELEDIKLPPMLIQPLVENAIKHGIATTEAKGMIQLEFRLLSETLLEIKVKDNGRGEINMENSKSKAIKILRERIALMEKGNEKASFKLYRERNETIAQLILPI